MFRFDAKVGYYLYPEAEGSDELKLWMNRGSSGIAAASRILKKVLTLTPVIMLEYNYQEIKKQLKWRLH